MDTMDASHTVTKRRQAVLLIHGIGEQQPMSTLRGFVSALLNGGGFFSKPDDLSLSYELRRLTHHDAKKGVETCFFEYYWAFRMRDTSIRHLYDWGERLLRNWSNVPSRLKPIWWFTSFVTLIAALTFIVALICYLLHVVIFVGWLRGLAGDATRNISQYVTDEFSVFGTLVAMIFAVVSGRFIYTLGDTARYLHSTPANVAERQAIRHDGLELLRKLHEVEKEGRPKYDRIIVVGHSLGSVIGYDILSFYWAAVNAKIPINDVNKLACLDACIANLRQSFEEKNKEDRRCQRKLHSDSKATEEFRTAQKRFREAQDELRKEFYQERWVKLVKQYSIRDRSFPKACPWRITDFITLGSPLTYAEFLLAPSRCDLDRRKDDRELPCIPPVTDQGHCWYEFDKPELPKKLHHAALFALTRWTNFYFAADKIGGPLVECFGAGVGDIQCPPLKGRDIFFGHRSHTSYWLPDDKDGQSSQLAGLRDILFGWQWEEECQPKSREPSNEPGGIWRKLSQYVCTRFIEGRNA